jgi:hypothetical protein
MKLYDKVKELLINKPELRDSDKKLLWEVWRNLGYLNSGALYYDGLMKRGCPTFESVTRIRRKIQERNMELRGSKFIQRIRKNKADTKGAFIYKETYTPILVDGKVDHYIIT